jgi:hypothetical protein
MTKIVNTVTRLTGIAALAALGACESEKSLTPTSPNVAGPIAGVNITTPSPVSPSNGTEVLNTETLRLVFGVAPAEGQQTSVVVDVRLGAEATYYWRVKADDGANASDYSPVAHFDIVVPVVVEAPSPASPINGQQTADNTPNLVVNNGRVEGRAGTVHYKFEVARDQAFSDIASVAYVPRAGGSTTTHPSAALPSGATLFWRVWATNGTLTNGPSAVASFRTPSLPAPGPGPSPGPLPPSGNCATLRTAIDILNCNHARYGGSMNDGETVDFLRSSARDLNTAGISGGRFGILVKTAGSNCNGYSCDIICSGQGGNQRQWDVLIDSGRGGVTWHEVGSGLTVRPCEIQ